MFIINFVDPSRTSGSISCSQRRWLLGHHLREVTNFEENIGPSKREPNITFGAITVKGHSHFPKEVMSQRVIDNDPFPLVFLRASVTNTEARSSIFNTSTTGPNRLLRLKEATATIEAIAIDAIAAIEATHHSTSFDPHQVSAVRLPASTVWRSTRLLAHWDRCRKELQSGRNLAPAFSKAHATKLQMLVHCLVIQVLCSKVSTLVVSIISRLFDVSTDHDALQPERRVSDASSTCSHCNGSPWRCVQFDFKAGTVDSVAWPFHFDLNSLLLQNHAEITQHRNTANSRSCCLDCCVEFGFGTRESHNCLQQMSPVEDFAGTRALAALQASGEV